LLSNFKFLRKYHTENQFLKVGSAHFYGSVFYVCVVCTIISILHIKTSFVLSITNCWYLLVVITTMESKCLSSKEMSNCANPDERSQYSSVSIMIKTLHSKHPNRIHSFLRSGYFEEPKKCSLQTFFDKSKTWAGRQSIQKRLEHTKTN